MEQVACNWNGTVVAYLNSGSEAEPTEQLVLRDVNSGRVVETGVRTEKEDYERYFQLARSKAEPGALIVADNVLSHEDTLGAYSRDRRADPTLESVTVPLDRGLELSVVLR